MRPDNAEYGDCQKQEYGDHIEQAAALLPTLAAALAGLALLALAPATLAGPVLDRIQSSGTLKVCIWPDYYGITFRNPRTQQLVGIDLIRLRVEGHADARRDLQGASIDHDRLGCGCEQPAQHGHAGRCRTDVEEHGDKLVTAKARNEIAVAQALAQAAGFTWIEYANDLAGIARVVALEWKPNN